MTCPPARSSFRIRRTSSDFPHRSRCQQDQRQNLLGVCVDFALSDAYGNIDDLRKLKLVSKFDYGKKTGKGGNILHLVRRSNLDFGLSVWHNYLYTSQVMAFCLAT